MPQAKKGLLKNHSLEKTTVLGQSTYLDLLVYVPSGDHFNLVPQYLLPVLTSAHPIIPNNKHMISYRFSINILKKFAEKSIEENRFLRRKKSN